MTASELKADNLNKYHQFTKEMVNQRLIYGEILERDAKCTTLEMFNKNQRISRLWANIWSG